MKTPFSFKEVIYHSAFELNYKLKQEEHKHIIITQSTTVGSDVYSNGAHVGRSD